MRRWPLVAAAAALCLAGCSTTSHPSASPATSAAVNAPSSATPSSTAPSSVINPDVIPPVITMPYVDAVFKVLEHIDGNVSRSLLLAGRLTQTDLTDLRAIYGNPLYAQEVKIAQQSIGENLSNVRRPPGDVVVKVLKILSASSDCIFVSTRSDYSSVLINPGQTPASSYFGLDQKTSQAEPSINPTPWSIFFNEVFMKPAAIPDQCTKQ